MCSSDLKGLLGKCRKAKSYLVETGNFLSNLRDGTQKEPKFESDNLEGQNSNNHLKENPEVLSRLGLRQEQTALPNCTLPGFKRQLLQTDRKANSAMKLQSTLQTLRSGR